MARKYWLDLFTGRTWEEFLKNGANVSGFRESRRKAAGKIHPGDYFLCYLTGVSRFIGALEVKSECYTDNTPVWEDEDFPVRFKVKLVQKLTAKTAVPVLNLKDKLLLFQGLKSPKAWSGFFRGSPVEFKENDGQAIVQAIGDAVSNPVEREYDEKKYWRRPKTYESKAGVVTIPEEEEEERVETEKPEPRKATHEEIQWLLLNLGSKLGLDIWVARNDRNKEYNGKAFKDIPHLRDKLPMQFDRATNRTIELIDVLWLQGDAIVAAFEVEHTSSVYSGLLRMADLMSMQPNIDINLFIVAPDDRHDKVVNEINRPTFARLKRALPRTCRFIPYSVLKQKIDQISDLVQHLKPDFIEDIAESCEPEEV